MLRRFFFGSEAQFHGFSLFAGCPILFGVVFLFGLFGFVFVFVLYFGHQVFHLLSNSSRSVDRPCHELDRQSLQKEMGFYQSPLLAHLCQLVYFPTLA